MFATYWIGGSAIEASYPNSYLLPCAVPNKLAEVLGRGDNRCGSVRTHGRPDPSFPVSESVVSSVSWSFLYSLTALVRVQDPVRRGRALLGDAEKENAE